MTRATLLGLALIACDVPVTQQTPPVPSVSATSKAVPSDFLEQVEAFIKFAEAYAKSTDKVAKLGVRDADCLPSDATLLGAPDPEAGYCAGHVALREDWYARGQQLDYDYKEQSPGTVQYSFGFWSATRETLTCAHFPGSRLRRRWREGITASAWCSVETGVLKGWHIQIRQNEFPRVWLKSPSWADGGSPFPDDNLDDLGRRGFTLP